MTHDDLPSAATRTPRPAEAPARRRFGIASPGIWKTRDVVARLLDADPVRLRFGGPSDVDLLVGWGHKPTADAQRRRAARTGLPYVALEDGFLRSVRPGDREPAIGWIVDRTGIYYDAREPSDLEAAVTRRAAETDDAPGHAVLAALSDTRLSKYNHAPAKSAAVLGLPAGRDVVVVVDQTFGDASVVGALADAATFRDMLEAAIAENPGRTIAVKIHPETISGRKRGHLLEAVGRPGVVILAEDVDPWSLIEIAARVYVVSSQFGLEAMLAGVPVTCFGAAAYAGWGLTDDRFPALSRRAARPTRAAFAAAAYLDHCRWIDPWTGRPIAFAEAVERLAFLRDRHHEAAASVCLGFSRWKRRAVTRFLDGIGGPPRFARREADAVRLARTEGARLVVWGSRPIVAAPGEDPPAVVRVEDGFLRSVGLGASFVAPASLVFDDRGIYYDPTRPSAFEHLAETTEFSPALIERAARLRETIVARGLSKYNEADTGPLALPGGRRCILVPGQVEDDASVRLGSPVVTTNADLLGAVRARHPDAFIVYKPHPDVHAGYRRGRVPDAIAGALADRVVVDVAMASLLAHVDAVETMTSLTGFEALIRGLPVTTHGAPFYAGWGLTEDLCPVPRRDRRLTIDALVALALVLYPRYVDPQTGLPCPVEVIVERLSAARARDASPSGRLRRNLRHVAAWSAHNLTGPIWRLLRRP
ncbi:capsular polysaccharide biosynthesis protein [Pinisolibacter aquiterrae]|uniref:capsular polysaccharide biosynthesis protein n=1 Tax=Pinisolibacter aquiterrae TaxID=2815579 RepID=UPI001C3C6C60|nr:capsular polysaccharide biosynthesis protein [Pinisolibacter aquiterrae]MCC8236709.1 capsular polysaccharide biosynthesis protein [Pinisolibacter aquiterrae]